MDNRRAGELAGLIRASQSGVAGVAVAVAALLGKQAGGELGESAAQVMSGTHSLYPVPRNLGGERPRSGRPGGPPTGPARSDPDQAVAGSSARCSAENWCGNSTSFGSVRIA